MSRMNVPRSEFDRHEKGRPPGGAARRWRRILMPCGFLLVLGLGIVVVGALRSGRPTDLAERSYARGTGRKRPTRREESLRRNPIIPGRVLVLARAEARLGRHDHVRASSIGDSLTDKLRAEDYYLVGRGLITEGQFEEGRYGLDQALELDPDHAESLLALVRLNRRSDRLEEALEQAARLSENPRWSTRGLVLLGLVRQALKEPSAAAEAFHAALARDPGLIVEEGSADQVRTWLAHCLLQAGRPDEAGTHLDAALRSKPDDAEAHWLQSRVALQERDWKAASAALQQAKGYGSDHPERPEPAAYVGFGRCAECHPTIVQRPAPSRHAQTFRMRGDLQDLPLLTTARPDPFDPSHVHEVTQEEGETVFHTRSPESEMRAIVEFVLGSGDRAMTPVGRDSQGVWREVEDVAIRLN